MGENVHRLQAERPERDERGDGPSLDLSHARLPTWEWNQTLRCQLERE